jgi:hypothetical protein
MDVRRAGGEGEGQAREAPEAQHRHQGAGGSRNGPSLSAAA